MLTKTCAVCGTDKDLQKHHVVPRSLFKDDADYDIEQNLLTVCTRCHGLLHGQYGDKSWSNEHSELVKKGIEKARKKGTRLGCPEKNKDDAGERQSDKSKEFCEKVKHHFIELIQRGMSNPAMATELNSRGVLTRLNKNWSNVAVHNFIKRHELREAARYAA